MEPNEEFGSFFSNIFELLFNFLKGIQASIDLQFFMFHEIIDTLDRLDLSVGIGHKGDIFLIPVDTKTKNSVLGLVGVLVGKKLLF